MPILGLGNRSAIVFLTVCTDKRRSLLCRNDAHTCLQDAWRKALGWQVGRYVLMPDHLHLFCAPSECQFPELARWVQYWKALASKAWPQPDEYPIWQKSYWDTQLRQGDSYTEKWTYVRANPVRAGLCPGVEEWPFQGEMNVLSWRDR